MYYKINPSGCCEKDGYVRILYSFFLAPGDYGYEKHCINKPIFPKEQYTGKEKDYTKFVVGLPTEMAVNPFHNHYIKFSPDVSDETLIATGEELLVKAYNFWSKDQFPAIKNRRLPIKETSSIVKVACLQRVEEIKQWAL